MRRAEGALVPLELSILEAAVDLAGRGIPEPHGFLLAREMRDRARARRLVGYGTLYGALERLERRGYLDSRWEDPTAAATAGRPRRRSYRLTVAGETATRDARAARRERTTHHPAAVVRT
jgi:PadR family transcriptional regulator PadR